jgi:hypothetical protein
MNVPISRGLLPVAVFVTRYGGYNQGQCVEMNVPISRGLLRFRRVAILKMHLITRGVEMNVPISRGLLRLDSYVALGRVNGC